MVCCKSLGNCASEIHIFPCVSRPRSLRHHRAAHLGGGVGHLHARVPDPGPLRLLLDAGRPDPGQPLARAGRCSAPQPSGDTALCSPVPPPQPSEGRVHHLVSQPAAGTGLRSPAQSASARLRSARQPSPGPGCHAAPVCVWNSSSHGRVSGRRRLANLHGRPTGQSLSRWWCSFARASLLKSPFSTGHISSRFQIQFPWIFQIVSFVRSYINRNRYQNRL